MFTSSNNLIKKAVPVKFEESASSLKRNPCTPTRSSLQQIETEIVSPSCDSRSQFSTPKRTYKITPSRKRNRDFLSSDISTEDPDINLLQTPTKKITPRSARYVKESIYLPEDGNPVKYKRRAQAPTDSDTPRKKKLKETIVDLQKNVKNKNLCISRLKSNKKSYSRNAVDRYLSKLSKNSKTLVLMQTKGNNKKWTKQEKKFAMSIYYKSPTTYSFLRRNGIVLPGESTVRRWFNSIAFSTGINKKYCEHLKSKASEMTPMQKACVIMFDEIILMKNIEYNRNWDSIEGLEDLGELGRTNRFGTSSFVIMIRGLYHQWKIPFSYYIAGSGGVKDHHLKEILEKTVSKLVEIGFCPKAIICDQGGQNQKVEPSFEQTEDGFYLISGCKLVWIFDVPHLMKSLRNNLLNGDFLIDDNKIVSFRDIVNTYIIDSKSSTSKSMLKITEAHLNPNKFKRMNCRLALQIFSHSVGTAIETAIATGELKSSTAKNTAEFIFLMNDLFDCLNSRQMYDKNPYKNALSQNHIWQFDTISKALQMFKKMKKVTWHLKKDQNEKENEGDKKENEGFKKVCDMGEKKKIEQVNQKGKKGKQRKSKKKENYTFSRPPCFEGFVTSLTSILKLFETERQIEEYSQERQPSTPYFLITSRLNQDPIENFFSIIRQKNGYNKNPPTKNFRCGFAHVTSVSFHKYTELGNCYLDEDFFLDLDLEKKEDIMKKVEENEIKKRLDDSKKQKENTNDEELKVKENEYTNEEENQNLITKTPENANEKEDADLNENGEVEVNAEDGMDEINDEDGINEISYEDGMDEVNEEDRIDEIINCDWEALDNFFLNLAQNEAAEGERLKLSENCVKGIAESNSPATLESCSNVYFSGRVVNWFKKNYECDECVKMIDGINSKSRVPEKHSILIKRRQYKNITDPKKGLENPTPLLVSVLILALNILSNKFKTNPEEKGFIKSVIVQTKK